MRLSASGRTALEALLHHLLAPLRARPLFLQCKAAGLVQATRCVESLEGPELDRGEALYIAKSHGRLHQTTPHAGAAHAVINDEPTQVRLVVAQIVAVDEHRSNDALTMHGQPHAVTFMRQARHELRHAGGDFTLEETAEADRARIETGMHLHHVADRPGLVSRHDLDVRRRR